MILALCKFQDEHFAEHLAKVCIDRVLDPVIDCSVLLNNVTIVLYHVTEGQSKQEELLSKGKVMYRGLTVTEDN